MQTLTQTRPVTAVVPAVVAAATPRRPALLLRLLDALGAADARYRQKVALLRMTDERLADMGMTRADAGRAFRG